LTGVAQPTMMEISVSGEQVTGGVPPASY